jgi:hypothetical protein
VQYAEALIQLLAVIAEKAEYLPGDVDKYLVTATNSLRSADYVGSTYPVCLFSEPH